jgi:hypothetical protein
MNSLGVVPAAAVAGEQSSRTWRVSPARSPLPARAESPVVPERVLSSMRWNNPANLDLAMPPLALDAPGVFSAALPADEARPSLVE